MRSSWRRPRRWPVRLRWYQWLWLTWTAVLLLLTAYLLVGEGLLFHFRDRPPFGVLFSRAYFGARLHRIRVSVPLGRVLRSRTRRLPTRRERVQALYGPSRRLLFAVVVVWLVALALLARVIAVMLRGLGIC